MKRFFRTAVGKAVLFIICVLSVIILGLSVVGIALSLDNADIMYLGTEETFCDELFIRELKYDGYRQVSQAVKMVSEGSGDMEILPDSGNALFAVRDEQGNKVIVSEGFFFAREWKYPLVYAVYAADDKEHDRDDLPFEVVYLGDNGYAEGYGPDEPYAKYTVWYSFKDGFPEADRYALIARYAPLAYRMRYAVFAIAFLSLLTAILSFVALMSVAGRRPDTEEIVTGPFSFIPYEIFVAAAVGIVIVMILAVEGSNGVLEGVIGCASAVIALCLFIGLSMCAASRIKQKTFFQNTLTAKALMLISGCLGAAWGLTKKVFDYFRQGLRNMSVTWKTVLVYLGFSFAELIAVGAADETDARVVMFILERALILPAVVIIAVIFKKLYAGGQALARGDLAHYIDTKGMFWDLKRHGEDLNSISSGMAIAVEDRLKSERMKAELITNVSHDIKTPLTSIINYASLIGEEEGTSEKTKEYTEVLVRQSERLKRLLEDLVEASKASTGN
ncbi:MAG: hypothetical protein J5744_07840, partial [Oscillospiraceae bacterium]|nr:hypothetical protein [Oscillospiraceae bacterium]